MANLLTTIAPEFNLLTQTNFLNRKIKDAKQPEYIWRRQAAQDMMEYPQQIGIPFIITARGLRAPNTTPNNQSNPSDLNAGISFSGINYEQFQIQIDRYDGGDIVDMFARHLPIADKFLETYITLAQGAESSQDFIARNVLYDKYTSCSTFVTANSGTSTTVWVDDIRGFVANTGAQGQVPTANVTVGSHTYTLSTVTANSTQGASKFVYNDGSFTGTPGILTFTSAVTAQDQAVNATVVAVNAPLIFYGNNTATNWSQVGAGNTMTMNLVQQMKNSLVNNRMKNPTLYATPDALYGLYQDSAFQLLYRGAYGSDTYRTGEVARLLGVDIVEVTSAPILTHSGVTIHMPIMTTDECLTEARMTDVMCQEEVDGPVHRVVEDNIAMTTTAPTDAAGQFVKIIYLQFVGYACRTDRMLTSAVVPTASNANYKRAAVLFCSHA